MFSSCMSQTQKVTRETEFSSAVSFQKITNVYSRHTHTRESDNSNSKSQKQANSSEKKRVKGNKSFLLYFHAVLAIVNVR